MPMLGMWPIKAAPGWFEALWANKFAPTETAGSGEFIRPMSMRGQPPRGGVG